ncbi:hypothetical protein AMK22_29960 [Streptomyces sp. CB01580]|nr:hypothetical protein AMK22_29960 [Streptomyces sp. CB01580]
MGRRSPIITAMGKRLVAEGCGKYTTGPGPEWTDTDRQSYAAWQRKIHLLGDDADGIPGQESWDRLHVPATSGTGGHVSSPVPGHTVTTAYHKRGPHWSLGYHTGADYAAPEGTSCVAVRSGFVRVGQDGSFGNYLVLRSGAFDYWYCHLSHRDVTRGSVRAGQRVAEVGSTGNTTGPHLHFEKRPAGGRFGSDVTPSW